MKKTLFIFLITLSIFTSCASNKSQKEELSYYDESSYDDYDYTDNSLMLKHEEATDDFLADFGVIQMQNLMMLKKSGKTVKPKEIRSVYLVPRQNSVEITYRDITNVITFKLDKKEREKILATCQDFLDQYEAKTLPHHKINAKTAFMNSHTTLWFGITSPTNECTKTEYYMNCEFIDKRPYLLLKFVPTRCDTVDAFTPKVEIYMSPSQIRDFMEQMAQENLVSLVEELSRRAYTY